MPSPGPSPTFASLPHAAPRRELVLLLAGALAVYTANPFGIGLRAVDDCHYARKGVEMARSGSFFTATWNGQPDFQYPSLQFWLLGVSFRLLGENDLAARVPSILQAIGTLLVTYRLGAITLGAPVATGAAALLAIAPTFADHARGCLTDMALTFWVSLAMLLALEGLRRPWLHGLMALPLGAAILTKSLLGLLPLPVLAVCAIVHGAWRRAARGPWLATGIVLGLLAGASWSFHQAITFGPQALRAHYLDGVGALASRPLGLLERLARYPIYLLERFQPIILPALGGLALAWRRRMEPGVLLLALWVVVPLVVLQVSGTQERRYLMPLFPALAVLGAWAIESMSARLAAVLRRVVAPALLGLAALWLWIAPPRFVNQADPAIAAHRSLLQSRIAAAEPLTYFGSAREFWPIANPLLYYAERTLEPSAPTREEALIRATTRASQLLLCDRESLPGVMAIAPEARPAVEGVRWVVLDVAPRSVKAPGL